MPRSRARYSFIDEILGYPRKPKSTIVTPTNKRLAVELLTQPEITMLKGSNRKLNDHTIKHVVERMANRPKVTFSRPASFPLGEVGVFRVNDQIACLGAEVIDPAEQLLAERRALVDELSEKSDTQVALSENYRPYMRMGWLDMSKISHPEVDRIIGRLSVRQPVEKIDVFQMELNHFHYFVPSSGSTVSPRS